MTRLKSLNPDAIALGALGPDALNIILLVLNFGRLIASGTPQEVRANGEVIDAYLGMVN